MADVMIKLRVLCYNISRLFARMYVHNFHLLVLMAQKSIASVTLTEVDCCYMDALASTHLDNKTGKEEALNLIFP